MNFSSAPTLLALLYGLLLAAAAVQDVLTLRISNLFSIAITMVCAAALVILPTTEWWQHLLSFGIVLGIGVLLFSVNWVGGGDAKLMAAAAMAFDLPGLVRFLPLTLMAGGVIALFAIVARIVGARRSPGNRGNIPYGVAVAVGAIAAQFLFPVHTAFGM